MDAKEVGPGGGGEWLSLGYKEVYPSEQLVERRMPIAGAGVAMSKPAL